MKTSGVGEILINTGAQKAKRFNFSHDVNTSYDWGSVQPLVNKMMLPGSTANIEIENLTRLAPMVVPTFGRVKIKNTAHFVKMQELWPNWDAMLGKKAVTRPSKDANGKQTNITFVPNRIPSIAADLLSTFVLTGSRMTCWAKLKNNDSLKGAWVQYGVRDAVTQDDKIAKRNILIKFLTKCLGMSNEAKEIPDLDYKGPTAAFCALANSITGSTTDSAKVSGLRIPCNTWANDVSDTENAKYGNPNIALYNHKIQDVSPIESENWLYQVKMSEADIAIEIPLSSTKQNMFLKLTDSEYNTLTTYFSHIGLAFRLSNFGKRLRKVIITSGLPIDFNDQQEYSIMPLLAYYKAWWETYAPERTINYYSSKQYKLIQQTLNGNDNSLTEYWKNKDDNNIDVVKEWIMELGNCFATEKMDVFAAATENPNLSDGSLIYDAQALQSLMPWYQTHIEKSSDTAPDFNASATPVLRMSQGANNEISQQQLDLLCQLYRMTNKASAAGQNLAETLKALGQGKEVEESQGYFINAAETTIQISDVVAQSATEERPLGDWGGKGMGHGLFKVSYSTEAYGILTIISCIVPESGYVNGVDMTLQDLTRELLPNPEFDGISVEAIQKKQINGVVQTSTQETTNPGGMRTFGFVPTYTKYKYMTNKANGDFSLYGKRNSMAPYTIDKLLPLQTTITDIKKNSKVDQTQQINDYDRIVEFCNMPMSWEQMPIAGEEWRYVSKYLWNGQYDRIFEMGVNNADYMGEEILSNNNSIVLFNSTGYDNFMSHNVINFIMWQKLKAIEESYNTFDEEHAPNSSVKKQ